MIINTNEAIACVESWGGNASWANRKEFTFSPAAVEIKISLWNEIVKRKDPNGWPGKCYRMMDVRLYLANIAGAEGEVIFKNCDLEKLRNKTVKFLKKGRF